MTGPRGLRAAGLACLLAAVTALSGCAGGDAEGPQVSAVPDSAYIPEPPTDSTAGGFLTLTNEGDEPDRLTGVTSDLSDDVQLHRTEDNRMSRVDSLEIPAGGELALSRGGNHVMFMELNRVPSEGETVALELRFEKSDPITLDVPVESGTYTGHAH